MYLGDVDLSVPHSTRFYCKSSNEIVLVRVGPNGEITKTAIKSKNRVHCPEKTGQKALNKKSIQPRDFAKKGNSGSYISKKTVK